VEKFVKLKKVKRKRKHGFLVKMRSFARRKTLKRRRLKGRVKMSV
jgi:ribosomal protein L34